MSDSISLYGLSPAAVRSARRAVCAVFFINGAVFASWAVNIPSVRARFELSTTALGLVLLVIAAGSVLSLPLTGSMIARWGSRPVVIAGTLGFCLTLPLLLVAPSVPALVALLAVLGVCNGAMDVSMNAHGVAIEKRLGRPTMSTFHALFSTGGLMGAAVGGLLLGAGVPPAIQTSVAAAALLIVAAAALPHLLPSDADRGSADSGPVFAVPRGALLGIAFLVSLSFIGEGAMEDWSAVYLRDVLGTTAGLAAAGFAAFSLAMAAGRFTGDAVRTRAGAVRTLRVSGIIAALGLGVALLIGQPLVALIGFACVGLGLANVVPILFSAAGATPGVPAGTALAAVASAGYLGFVAGPPLIGALAHEVTLPRALLLVVAFAALIATLAPVARRAPGAEDQALEGAALREWH